jgi:hypothetical protein
MYRDSLVSKSWKARDDADIEAQKDSLFGPTIELEPESGLDAVFRRAGSSTTSPAPAARAAARWCTTMSSVNLSNLKDDFTN